MAVRPSRSSYTESEEPSAWKRITNRRVPPLHVRTGTIRTGCEHVFVSREAAILHADLDSFFASVEQRDDPRLRGRPVIVGGGVVLAASYEAKAYGVGSAMGGATGAAAVPARGRWCRRGWRPTRRRARRSSRSSRTRRRWSRGSRSTRRSSTCAGWSTSPARRARSRRGCARGCATRSGCRSRSGSRSTKYLAKVASAIAKPDGLLVVPPGEELAFLHPLPVERLWGVGPATAGKLHARGLRTVGEVAALPEADAGRDRSAAPPGGTCTRWPTTATRGGCRSARRRRSIGSQRALGRGARGRGRARRDPGRARGPGARRLRAAERACRTVVLRLRFADFTRASRARTRCRRRPTETGAILAALRDAAGGGRPLIPSAGSRCSASRSPNLYDARRGPARAAVRTGPARGARRGASTRCASASGGRRSRARAARSRPGGVDAAAARLSRGSRRPGRAARAAQLVTRSPRAARSKCDRAGPASTSRRRPVSTSYTKPRTESLFGMNGLASMRAIDCARPRRGR